MGEIAAESKYRVLCFTQSLRSMSEIAAESKYRVLCFTQSLLPSARSMSEIAAELSRSTTSLPGSTGSDLSRSASSQSLPSLTTSRFDREYHLLYYISCVFQSPLPCVGLSLLCCVESGRLPLDSAR